MPLRILIVEDERMIALDLTDILEGAGHKVVGYATTMAQALKLASETKPDLALMDMELEDGSSGLEAAEALGASSRLPILFLTGRGDFMVRAMALDIQPLGFVTKPYRPDDVLAALSHAA